MDFIKLIKKYSPQLSSLYESAELQEHILWIMLSSLTNKSRNELFLKPELITAEVVDRLEEWIKRHTLEFIPLAYLIGSIPFGDCELLIEPPILIPRPETEEWVHNLISPLKLLKNKNISLLDLCTGSGAIALALAKALPEATIYATDISLQALALAQKNSLKNNITSIQFIQSDLFEHLEGLRFDIIVTNPPYISHQEWINLDPMVNRWEDYRALVAEDNGLALLKKIIAQAPHFLRPNEELLQKNSAQFYTEIGYQQADAILPHMKNSFCEAVIIQDYAGHNRVAVGRKGSVEARKKCSINS